jgi:hypothetical protein
MQEKSSKQICKTTGLIMRNIYYNIIYILQAFVVILIIQCCAKSSKHTNYEFLAGQLQSLGVNNVLVNNNKIDDSGAALIHNYDHIVVNENSSDYIHYILFNKYYVPYRFTHFDQNTSGFLNIGIPEATLIFEKGQIYNYSNDLLPLQIKTKFLELITYLSSENSENYKPVYSAYNLITDEKNSILTVLNGKMIIISPEHIELMKGQQITVSHSGIESLVELSGSQLDQVTSWHKQYPEPLLKELEPPSEMTIEKWATYGLYGLCGATILTLAIIGGGNGVYSGGCLGPSWR